MAPNWIIRFVALAFGVCTAAFAQPADHPYGRSQPIAGRYIVVFKAHVANPAAEAASLARGLGAQLHFTYTSAIKGFAATLPDAAVQALRNNPNVDYVEQDQTVSLNEIQTGATWGLDRIDQSSPSLNGSYHYNSTGTGVNAFIIDTGIRSSHGEFGVRAVVDKMTTPEEAGTDKYTSADGFTAINDGKGTDDCNGHGTHVAGTVGGTTWGVAKAVSLIPVRVLDCDGRGTWSGVIAGVDFVAASTLRPAVANMSLGGGASTAVDDSVAGAIADGVTVVVAAGNSDADACNYSPARAPGAITVGATTSGDKRAVWFPKLSGSNWGTCVDIFAPGDRITSAWNASNTAINTISGTSMASPHVAGVAALALAAYPASPAAAAAFLTDGATSGALTDEKTSPDLLVYSLATGSPTDPAVHVHSLAGSSGKAGKNWKAYADITVDRSSGGNDFKPVPNATVTGTFVPGGKASCLTDNTGRCRLSSATIENKTPSTSFTVESVSGHYLNYSPTADNHGGTQKLISKP